MLLSKRNALVVSCSPKKDMVMRDGFVVFLWLIETIKPFPKLIGNLAFIIQLFFPMPRSVDVHFCTNKQTIFAEMRFVWGLFDIAQCGICDMGAAELEKGPNRQLIVTKRGEKETDSFHRKRTQALYILEISRQKYGLIFSPSLVRERVCLLQWEALELDQW